MKRPAAVKPYNLMIQRCLEDQNHGRQTTVEPAYLLLLLDRVKALESVARAAKRLIREEDDDRMPTRWGGLHRALARLEPRRPSRGRAR